MANMDRFSSCCFLFIEPSYLVAFNKRRISLGQKVQKENDKYPDNTESSTGGTEKDIKAQPGTERHAGMEIYHFLHQKQTEGLQQQRKGNTVVWT